MGQIRVIVTFLVFSTCTWKSREERYIMLFVILLFKCTEKLIIKGSNKKNNLVFQFIDITRMSGYIVEIKLYLKVTNTKVINLKRSTKIKETMFTFNPLLYISQAMKNKLLAFMYLPINSCFLY